MAGEREERFRRLWEDERSSIAAYALRRADSPEDAADVVADTFAVAWKRLDDVPRGPEARLWLYATARNTLANLRRANRRRWQLAERFGRELRRATTFSDAPDAERAVAWQRLQSLDEADREVLMLVAWEGLDSAELGRVLGCSAVAARIRLHRARGRLSDERAVGISKRPPAAGHVPGTDVAVTPQTKTVD